MKRALGLIIEGANPFKMTGRLAKEVGCDKSVAENAVKKLEPLLMDVMREAGITKEMLVNKMKEGLEAFEKRIAAFEGKITDQLDVPDFAERRNMMDMILKLMNAYPKQEIDMNVNACSVIRLPSKKPIGDGAVALHKEEKIIEAEVNEKSIDREADS